jgi:hypothetical protein
VVVFEVPDRDSGQLRRISHAQELLLEIFTADQMRECIRRQIEDAVVHEMHECLLFDGVRRWDPHARAAGKGGY